MSILAVGLAQPLMTHPGVGPVTALASTLTMGLAEHFSARQTGRQLPGVDSQRHSSGGHQQRPGAHQQTRQPVSARPAGGSGAECGAA